ncbi:hypothetical protein EBZ80_04830 [bacterium]|nr:hypothetical protein [bacterium]
MEHFSGNLSPARRLTWGPNRAIRVMIMVGACFASALASGAQASGQKNGASILHRVRWTKDSSSETIKITSHKKIPLANRFDGRHGKLRTAALPAIIAEHSSAPVIEWNEVEGANLEEIVAFLSQNKVPIDREKLADGIVAAPGQPAAPESKNGDGTEDNQDEVRTIISSGPSSNRIDIVFMGDGYTTTEREKFFSDINRLVDDMFLGDTFKSYLPVFNVHVVFRASRESGLPRQRPGNTAYGLYREGDTLRAIFPGDTAALRESCDAAPDCDYPVVIANDPWYGGLGGEFAISTSSQQSGTVVLRHELGHNFGRVGEEYDGGGYFGANHADETSSIGWRHWTSDSVPRVREEPMTARYLGWPWHDFKKGPFEARFKSNGQYAKTAIRFSASGFGSAGSLEVRLDDMQIPFNEPQSHDRTFVDIEVPSGLAPGDHRLVFRAIGDATGPRGQWLSSLTVHEYAGDFHDEPGLVSAFPVFDSTRSVAGYRPTNESCLMRDMTSQHFCQVCQENNWIKFLDRIDLIDHASMRKSGAGVLSAEVTPLELGQFRRLGQGPEGERIEIRWFADRNELTQFRDIARWEVKSPLPASRLEVEVKLLSPEIRSDRFGTTTQRITIDERQDSISGS